MKQMKQKKQLKQVKQMKQVIGERIRMGTVPASRPASHAPVGTVVLNGPHGWKTDGGRMEQRNAGRFTSRPPVIRADGWDNRPYHMGRRYGRTGKFQWGQSPTLYR